MTALLGKKEGPVAGDAREGKPKHRLSESLKFCMEVRGTSVFGVLVESDFCVFSYLSVSQFLSLCLSLVLGSVSLSVVE